MGLYVAPAEHASAAMQRERGASCAGQHQQSTASASAAVAAATAVTSTHDAPECGRQTPSRCLLRYIISVDCVCSYCPVWVRFASESGPWLGRGSSTVEAGMKQTDRQTDRRADTMQPVAQHPTAGCAHKTHIKSAGSRRVGGQVLDDQLHASMYRPTNTVAA